MIRRGDGGQGGFTLLEVLVALAILGTVVAGWLAAFGSELRTMARSSEVVTAASLARERLASIELLAAHRLPSLPDSLEAGAFPEPLEMYRWAASARAVRGRSLVELDVTVSGPGASRRLTTLVPVSRPSFGGPERP